MARKPQNPEADQAENEAQEEQAVRVPLNRAPDSQVPQEGMVRGETSQNPRGVDTAQPQGNFYNDPTDNRAIGKQSNSEVDISTERQAEQTERRQGLAEGTVSRERPTQSPDPRVMAGVLMAPLVPAVTPEIKARDVEYLDGVTVELTAPHYLNDVHYDSGTVLENYTGPKSRNMREVQEGRDYNRAAEIERKLVKQQTSFQVRSR